MAPEFSNAPLCTIDIAALKATRFLLPDTRQLAYRDAAGRINSHLLLECAKQVKRGAVTVGEDVRTKLDKWVRHAKWWEKEQGVSWERSPTGVWVSSAGERLEETREAALMRQRTEELEPKAASRVDDAVRKERRRALETLRLQKAQGGSEPAAGGGGGKREPAGGGGGKREPEADGGGGGKRERAAAEGGSSEARSKRSCPQSASEAEAESEAESEADSDAEAEAGLDKVIGKCEGVATRIREKFKPLLEEDSAGGPGGQGDSLRQPPLMSSELAMKPHQLIGLSWLHGLHQHGTGGILADEMGLGKTVQTISLLAQLLGEGDEGPHLVVAPVATLENWMREFAMWCPALRVVKFHGDEATKAAVRSSFSRRSDEEPPHVVVCGITAFSGSSERARQEQAFLQRKLGRVGARGKLSYLVVDEAQKLKNDKSNVHQNVSKVEACHRLLLTGTPVENNPAELLTLLSFVAPRLFTASGKGSRASLSALFSSVGKGDGVACAPKVAKVQQLMRPFVLRRLKQEVLSALPPKTEEVAVVRMPPAQGAAYSETVARIAAQQRETLERWARRKAADRAELDAGCEEEVDGRDRGWIASAFTDLRKAAQHPLLLLRHYRPLLPRIAHALHCEGAFGDECTSEMVLSELETWSDIQVHLNCKAYSALRSLCLPSASLLGSAKAQKLASLLPPLVEEGHRALIFSQWTQTLDVLEELLHSLGIAYRRMDGAVSPQERQTIVDDFTADVSISCLLLSTRACGLGINLTSADTVILHDVDFNPAVDQQAMDRVHRIGQTRPVRVITLATEGTVDEKVLAIASKKVLSQHTLLGEGGAQADGARDSHAGLMGSILREVLLSRSSEGHHPGETRGGETRGGEPDGGEAAAVGEASAMEVEAEAVSQGEAVSQAEAGQGEECGAAGDVAGGEAEASGGGGGAAVSEETLRRLICERLAACEAEEEVSVKAVLRELSSRLGVDLKAAGLKPLVLQILGEEAR